MSSDDLPDLPRAKGPALSLREARPGNMLLVDPTGEVVPTRSWPVIVSGLKILGAVSGMVVLATWIGGALLGPAAGFAASTLVTITALLWLRAQTQLGVALQRLGADDLAGADELGRRVAARWWSSALVRGNALFISASARWLRGDLPGAQETNRRAMALLSRSRAVASRPIAALSALADIQLTAILGDPKRARVELDALERRGDLSAGDLVQIQHVDTRLVLAFEANDPTALPADLDPWTQQVLATRRFGTTLVLLAWAHHRRREVELGDALLEVAHDRLPECHLDAAHPRLAAWYRSAIRACASQPH